MLTNPIYYGEFRWNGKVLKGLHTPLIDRELFDDVQKVIGGRCTTDRTSRRDFTYSGLLKCAHCGCSIVGEIHKGRYIYYHCTGHKGGACKKDYVREESLDEQIAVVLKQIEMSDELIEIVKEALKESQKTQVEFRIQALRKIAENETKLRNRLDKSYLDKLDGVISESAYQEMSTKWKNQLRDLELQREKYNDTEFDYYETGGKILELAKRAHQLYLHAESDKKRKIVQLLFSNSELNGKVIEFKYKKPFNYIAEGLSVLSSSPNHPVGRTFTAVYYLPESTRTVPQLDKPSRLYRNPVFVAEEWRNHMQIQGVSRAGLAQELGVTRARVTQILNVMKLPENVLEKVRKLGDPMERRLVTERKLRGGC